MRQWNTSEQILISEGVTILLKRSVQKLSSFRYNYIQVKNAAIFHLLDILNENTPPGAPMTYSVELNTASRMVPDSRLRHPLLFDRNIGTSVNCGGSRKNWRLMKPACTSVINLLSKKAFAADVENVIWYINSDLNFPSFRQILITGASNSAHVNDDTLTLENNSTGACILLIKSLITRLSD